MAASSNSWLQQTLLPHHSTQQQSSSHSLFHNPELPLHCTHLGPSQHVDLGHGSSQGMDPYLPLHHTMHPSLHMPGEIPQQPNQPLHGMPGSSGRAAGSIESGDAASVRKVHKADREKLRRDRLNEQFGELAGVLDPERPKNDKATILGDSVQVVKELRGEVKRLKTEHESLMDEQRDLSQEKIELREEKAALKTETEQLQSQLQQRLRGLLPWMTMDPSAAMMGAAPYTYSMPVPQPQPQPATPPRNTATSEATPTSNPSQQQPVVSPPPYLSLAPPGVYMHPYAMYGTQHPEGGHAYMPYPPYPTSIGTHAHVERPYAQYPSPLQSMPGYLVQMQGPQGGANFRPPFAVPGMSLVPPGQASGPHAAYPQYTAPGPRHGSQASPAQTVSSPEPPGVETSLRLQTPGEPACSIPAPQPQSQQNSHGKGETLKAEGAGLELTTPGARKLSEVGGGQVDDTNDSNDVISTLTLSSSSVSRTDTAPTPTAAETEGTPVLEEARRSLQRIPESILRPQVE